MKYKNEGKRINEIDFVPSSQEEFQQKAHSYQKKNSMEQNPQNLTQLKLNESVELPEEPKQFKIEEERVLSSHKVRQPRASQKPKFEKKIEKLEENLSSVTKKEKKGLSGGDVEEIKGFIRAEINQLRLDIIKEFEMQKLEIKKMLDERNK